MTIKLNKYLIFKQCTFVILLMLFNTAYGQYIEGGSNAFREVGGITKAEKLYKNLGYYEAIPIYEKYLKKNDSARAMVELADCYRLTTNFEKAEEWYRKGVEKGGIPSVNKLHLAQMLQANGKYEEASKWYSAYLLDNPDDKRSKNDLKASLNFEEYLQTKDRYKIENLSFNSPGYDFSSALFDGGLIYSSSRDSARALNTEHTWTGTQFFDLFYVKGDKTTFGKAKRLKGDASTKFHEAAITFTPDNKKVFFTRNNYYKGKAFKSEDDIIKLKIYESDVNGKEWKNDKNFPFNDDQYSIGHPALTPDGNTMYFVSDMPGGYGQTDIYITKREGESWSKPENLGPSINTEGREMFPYLDKEGTFFFASDGQGGLGGLDIFKSNWNKQTKDWGKIRNIGSPINSSFDDFSLNFGNEKSYGYFTSNRPGGKGLDDIYYFTDEGISLEGIVVDAVTNQPICTGKVIMKLREPAEEKGRKITECDGEFDFAVDKNTDYCFLATADGYASNNSVCSTTKGVPSGGKVYVRIPLVKQKPASMVVLVRDMKTKRPIDSASIVMSGQCDGTNLDGTTNISGVICRTVKCDCDYMAVVTAKGYLPGSGIASAKGRCEYLVNCGEPGGDTLVIELNRISADDNLKDVSLDTNLTVELKDIYYDFDKWYTRQESERELNKLLGFMQENLDAIVEIGSHTDSRAPYDYNMKLSQRRAQSVVDWLIIRGINKNRLSPNGYGETKPKNDCRDGVQCSEYEHQRNRRTEFRVVGGNIDIKSLERFDMQVDPCKVCPF